MLGRLKFDIDPLVTQMLDSIPNDLIVNGTILDPAMGGGQFVFEVERRKRAAGKSDEEIKNTVFGIEENILRRDYAVNKHKLVGTYSTGNFLDKEINMKFDVIIGNPPYQNSHDKDAKAKRKVGNKLWYQFIFKADNLVKEGGYVAMVSPNQWLTGGVNMRKGGLGVLKDIFAVKQLIKAVVSGVNEKYFPKIGISIGWWVYKNEPNTQPTELDLGGSTIEVDFNGLEFLTPEASKLSIGIVTKTLLANNPKFESYYFNSQCKPGVYQETAQSTNINQYPHWIMGSSVTSNLVIRYFPKLLNERVGYKKILFPMSTRYWQPYLADADISVASLGQALKVEDSTTQIGFESVFYSKLFKYMCYNLQIAQNGFMKTVLVRALPKLDMSKAWTDAELYKHFNLTVEEIDYIESNTN
jgi:hypothetical protein